MHIVYKIVFNKRKQRNEKPYYYIGSKSNCVIHENKIIDKNGNPYYGSSSYKNYTDIVNEGDISIEILKITDCYTTALNFESLIQKQLDVVANTEYFNLSVATVNSFTNPDYATYKHIVYDKIVRLPRNHPMVKSGEYVGVSKGSKLTKEQRKKIGKSGKDNPFFGKKHTEETKQKIRETNRKFRHSEESKVKMSQKRKGVPKTSDHRRKIGRKNMIMLKNKDTHKTIRIPKEEAKNYDPLIWMNPAKLSDNVSKNTMWINDGFSNKRIKKDQDIPENWKKGKIRRKNVSNID